VLPWPRPKCSCF